MNLFQRLLRRTREPLTAEPRSSLAALLFTDIVRSTERAVELGDRPWHELLSRHHRAASAELRRYGGRRVTTSGDGFLAAFGEPGDAIRCACAIHRGARELGLELRSGIHMGQVEGAGRRLGGVAVHTAARVAASAAPGEVLVSSTVRELIAGSGFAFRDRGAHALRGVPGEWRLYAVSGVPHVLPKPSRHSQPYGLGRTVLGGTAVFLLLFLIAGLYVGLRERAAGRAGAAATSHTQATDAILY